MTISCPGMSASTTQPSSFVRATRPLVLDAVVRVGAEQHLPPFEDRANQQRVLEIHVHQALERDCGRRANADMMPLGHVVFRHEDVEQCVGLVFGRRGWMPVAQPCRADESGIGRRGGAQ